MMTCGSKIELQSLVVCESCFCVKQLILSNIIFCKKTFLTAYEFSLTMNQALLFMMIFVHRRQDMTISILFMGLCVSDQVIRILVLWNSLIICCLYGFSVQCTPDLLHSFVQYNAVVIYIYNH